MPDDATGGDTTQTTGSGTPEPNSGDTTKPDIPMVEVAKGYQVPEVLWNERKKQLEQEFRRKTINDLRKEGYIVDKDSLETINKQISDFQAIQSEAEKAMSEDVTELNIGKLSREQQALLKRQEEIAVKNALKPYQDKLEEIQKQAKTSQEENERQKQIYHDYAIKLELTAALAKTDAHPEFFDYLVEKWKHDFSVESDDNGSYKIKVKPEKSRLDVDEKNNVVEYGVESYVKDNMNPLFQRPSTNSGVGGSYSGKGTTGDPVEREFDEIIERNKRKSNVTGNPIHVKD